VGRGLANGKGRKCGRGQKGFKARQAAASPNRAFEGGQSGIVKALPKIGPQTARPVAMQVLAVEKVVNWVRRGRLPAHQPITLVELIRSGCVSRLPKAGVHLVRLTEAPIPMVLDVQVNGASADVIRAVEAVPGGKVSTCYYDRLWVEGQLAPERFAVPPVSPRLPPSMALMSRYADPAQRGNLAPLFAGLDRKQTVVKVRSLLGLSLA
jgi:large subunit ribosomal protein L15